MQFESGTDVQFINEYTQILSRNLDSIIKNNFLLEAKYAILERTLSQKLNVEEINQQLIEEKNKLEEAMNELRVNNGNLRDQYIQDILGEKQRIQDAFNSEMREHASLRSSFDSLQPRISHLENEKNELINSVNLLQNQISEKDIEKLNLLDTIKNLEEKIFSLKKAADTTVKPLTIDKKIIKKDKKKMPEINKAEVKSGGTF